MKKKKRLTPTQLENIRQCIDEWQKPVELEELYKEVTTYLAKREVRRVQDAVFFLLKFTRIMEGER